MRGCGRGQTHPCTIRRIHQTKVSSLSLSLSLLLRFLLEQIPLLWHFRVSQILTLSLKRVDDITLWEKKQRLRKTTKEKRKKNSNNNNNKKKIKLRIFPLCNLCFSSSSSSSSTFFHKDSAFGFQFRLPFSILPRLT